VDLQRPKRSAEQIASLPPFGSAEREAFVRSHGASFSPETLVYLLRESAQRADTSLFHFLGTLLVGRIEGDAYTGGHCESIIMSVAVSVGLHRDRTQLQEFRARVYRSMWHAIQSGAEEKHFWEERFGAALKDKCIELARRQSAERRRQVHQETDVDDPGLRPVLSDHGRSADHGLGGIDANAMMRAIDELPDRQRLAAFLTWIEGRQIAGDSDDCVARIMRISETAVHNLLAKARARLAAHPIIRELRNAS